MYAIRSYYVSKLKTDYDTKVSSTQPVIDRFDGFMARINALGELPWIPSFFIFLLFLAIETAPILAKLLSPKGEYDYKLEDVETAVKVWVEQKVYERNVLLKTDRELNNRIYSDIAEEDELYSYKRKKARITSYNVCYTKLLRLTMRKVYKRRAYNDQKFERRGQKKTD